MGPVCPDGASGLPPPARPLAERGKYPATPSARRVRFTDDRPLTAPSERSARVRGAGSVQSVFSYFSHFRTAAYFQREPGPVKGREAIRAADAEGALDRTGLPRIIKRPEMGASHQTNNPHTKQTRRSLQAGHSRNRSESTVCREPGTMPSCRTIPVGLSKATLSPRTPPDQLAGTPPSLGVATPIPLSRPGPG